MRLRSADMTSPFLRIFTDLLFNILIIVVLVLALIAQLVKKIKVDENKSPEQMVMMLPVDAELVFAIKWPSGSQDIDLWARGPDKISVGYSNTRSGVLGYLRDDVGPDFADKTFESAKNYEIITAPSFVPGHYVVNVHFYNGRGDSSEVSVDCQILIHKNNEVEEVYRGKVNLTFVKEERTIIQFDLIEIAREKFAIDRSSINSNFHSIVPKLK